LSGNGGFGRTGLLAMKPARPEGVNGVVALCGSAFSAARYWASRICSGAFLFQGKRESAQ
jgi:hypothetical protein